MTASPGTVKIYQQKRLQISCKYVASSSYITAGAKPVLHRSASGARTRLGHVSWELLQVWNACIELCKATNLYVYIYNYVTVRHTNACYACMCVFVCICVYVYTCVYVCTQVGRVG